MLTLALGTGAPIRVAAGDRPGLWAPLYPTVQGLGLSLVELGQGRIGICPDIERCILVPVGAIDRSGEVPRLDLDFMASALGLRIAYDAAALRAAVVLDGRSDDLHIGAAGMRPSDEIFLPDVRTGEPIALAEAGRRSCVFAWASW